MTTEIVPQIVYGAVLLFLLGAVAALWNRMGNVQKDLGRLEVTVAGIQTSMDEKTVSLQTSINEKTAALQASVDALMKTQHEMQLQMQRNHYQMMMAILSHSHRPDGRPTFDLPPDFEPNPSSGDPDD